MVREFPLEGRIILVLEDEPLVALDLVDCFQNAGATVLNAHTVEDGLRFAEHPTLAAALIDFRLRGVESTAVADRLYERGIPFILHTGYNCTSLTASSIISKP